MPLYSYLTFREPAVLMLLHQNLQECSLKLRGLGSTTGVSNPGGLGWAWESTFSDMSPGDERSLQREDIMLILMVLGVSFHTREDH